MWRKYNENRASEGKGYEKSSDKHISCMHNNSQNHNE